MNPADLALVGGAAGVGAIVGALLSSGHVSLVRHKGPPPRPAGPPTVVPIHPHVRLLPSGGTSEGAGRALRLAPPYDWARDELGV